MYTFTRLLVLCVMLVLTLTAHTRPIKQKKQDPCSELRFLALMNEAPTISATDVRNLPHCFNGKFIRLIGVYRIAFENSDLCDPTGDGGSTWVSFDPFYSAVKRCSSPEALRLLNREKGGTFGFVAMGVFHSGGGFGHLNGWANEFQVICMEKLTDLSDSGSVLEYQDPKARKRILDWYAKEWPK
jgi:hypothetical protein